MEIQKRYILVHLSENIAICTDHFEILSFRWGHIVATYPWVIIGSTFTVTTLLSLGFLLFRYYDENSFSYKKSMYKVIFFKEILVYIFFVYMLLKCGKNNLESNMTLTISGSRHPPPSNPTKNGETNIFRGTPDMKIFCSKGKMC